MVEEIRTLLLNSKKFKNYVYFPEDYSERKLNNLSPASSISLSNTDVYTRKVIIGSE